MKKISKKILGLMLVLITICCVPNLAFASESLESEKEIVEINEQTLQLTQNDRKNFEEFADKLALELQNSEEEDYDKIIQRAYRSGSNII
ncbi:MAG: hypothetical protein PUI98_07670 [Finegoldia magna]|nr:hypothetical protein [Finegoldia magna]